VIYNFVRAGPHVFSTNDYANFDFLVLFLLAKSIALTNKAGKQLVLTSQNLENHNKLIEGRHKYGRHLKRRRLPVKRTISDFLGTGSQAADAEEPVEATEVAADEAEEVASEVNDGNVSDDTYGFGSLAGSDRDESDGEGSDDYDWFGLGNDDAGDESDYDLFGSDNEADTDRRTSGAKKNQKDSVGQKTNKKNKQTDGDDEDGWFDW
jgi:hypothetical protein